MGILYDMKLMFLYDSTAFVLHVKPQKGKELIVEWHRNAHVFDRYLDVVNDRLHLLNRQSSAQDPREAFETADGCGAGPIASATSGR